MENDKVITTKKVEDKKPIRKVAASQSSFRGGRSFTPNKPGGQSGFAGGKGGFHPKSKGFAGGGHGGRGGKDGGSHFMKSDVESKILSIRRVARVTKGGKRFSFSVALVVGDKKGKVGIGIGKASDVTGAIEKATKDGKRNMFKVNITKDMSIPYEVQAKYESAVLSLRPSPGSGIVAGSSARAVLSLAGITGVSGKFYSRGKNPLNNAQATIKALKMFN